MSEAYEPLDIIAVGAHPDDVEIACGGMLAEMADQGYKVGIVDLTDGEPTPLSAGPEVRLAEAQAAAQVLGVQQRVILDLPNRKLFDSFEARVALAKEFRKFRPKIVVSFGDKTPMASPDHWQAMQIVDAAVFYSRLTKWDDVFEDLPVHTISAQLYFRLAFEPNFSETRAGQFTFDISKTLERKIESIRCYKTQFPPEKEYVFRRVESTAIAVGTASGFKAGESLVATKMLGSRNLFTTLFPSRQDDDNA